MNYKCINKIYKNNVITHYVLSDGTKQVTYPAEQVKAAMLQGKLTISNLKFSADGKLIDNIKDNIITDYYDSCRTVGIEPLQIEKQGDDYIVVKLPNSDDIHIPPFVTGFKIQQQRGQGCVITPVTSNPMALSFDDSGLNSRLDNLNLKVDKLINATGFGFKTIGERIEETLNYIKENQEELKEAHEKISKIGGFTWNEFGTMRSKMFPIDFDDINCNKVYTNKGTYKDAQAFSDLCMRDTTTFLAIRPDESITQELYKHLTAVNDIRITMVDAYRKSMDSNRANAMQGLQATALSSLVGTSMACACILNPALALGASASAVLGLTKTIVNTGVGGKIPLRGDFLTWQKRHDVYGSQNGYVGIDRTNLTSDKAEFFDAYAADIRVFVIDTLSCGYRRGIRDKDQVQNKYRHKKYFKYVEFSIGRVPVDDERLFYFYCKLYLDRVRKYSKGKDKVLDTDYYYTETGYTALKCYVDNFVNAFFAARKFLGYDGLDFLYDMDKDLTNVERKRYVEFLYYVKYGLLIQGMDVDFADYLIGKYIEYDSGLTQKRAIKQLLGTSE